MLKRPDRRGVGPVEGGGQGVSLVGRFGVPDQKVTVLLYSQKLMATDNAKSNHNGVQHCMTRLQLAAVSVILQHCRVLLQLLQHAVCTTDASGRSQGVHMECLVLPSHCSACLAKDEACYDEVRGWSPLGVHWDEAHGLGQLHSHGLHLAPCQHPQRRLHTTKASHSSPDWLNQACKQGCRTV